MFGKNFLLGMAMGECGKSNLEHRVQELEKENQKLENIIKKTIEQIEHIRYSFDESLQSDFILLENILKGEE